MRFVLHLLLLVILTSPLQAESWLAVSPDPQLTSALAPLVEHRRTQGLEVSIATTSVEEAIVTHGSPPDYLLIVGSEQLIPARRGSQYRWLSTQNETFAADPLFSDLDDDGLPEFPVGRIPANTPEQLGAVVEKIIAYENRTLSLSDLNIPIWSGTPAYGKLLDESADWLLMSTTNKHLPNWIQPWLITANSNNTLNAWPDDQSNLFNTQIQKGAVFTAMMGHGNTDLFLSMEHPKFIAYTNQDTKGLHNVSPPLVIFACDCGNFTDSNRPSLAATLLLGAGGPVATIAATTESHPLTNYYSSIALMQALANPDFSRVGDLWLSAQNAAMKMRKPLIERMLKNVEGTLEVDIDIPKLKRDQAQMYAYLGDPAQRIALPEELNLTVTKSDESTWKWNAEKPTGAQRIVIQHRPQSEPLRAKPTGTDRAKSLQLFAQRNQQFAFETLAELEIDAVWSGEIQLAGDLRIVAFSPGKMYVVTKKLR